MKKLGIVLGLVSLGIFYLLGCGPKTENFGEAIEANAAKTAIGTILLNPQEYVNKKVVVEGKITSECPTGGWINIKDGSGGTIYVEMHGTSITLPQRVGSEVVVKGMVFQTESQPVETKILAKGVILK